MDEIWKNLEHMNPNEFSRDDYTYLTYLVKAGLRKRHGEVEPKYAFIRKEETVVQRKTDATRSVKVPRLTVCYLRPGVESPEEGITAVGLAYCSIGDNPNKFYGRALAFKRSVAALLGRQDCDENFIRPGTQLETFLCAIGRPIAVKSFVINSPDYRVMREDVTDEEE